ncbi:MAG: hypothetical protein KUG76_01645 [Gammaproteobacteria bacterium]|nr:hypothetical protein [Gammaproteobacteria bacterium]
MFVVILAFLLPRWLVTKMLWEKHLSFYECVLVRCFAVGDIIVVMTNRAGSDVLLALL